MSNFVEELIRVAEDNQATRGIIGRDKAEMLSRLSAHMLEVNKSLNLTAIKDEDGVILKHLVDSAACVPYIEGKYSEIQTHSPSSQNVTSPWSTYRQSS